MHATKNGPKQGPLPSVSFRVSPAAKRELQRRADERSRAERRQVRPGEVAREALEFGLKMLGQDNRAPDAEELIDDVMASALYSKMALQLLLHEHEEMSKKLLRACQADVKRRKHGQRILGGSG